MSHLIAPSMLSADFGNLRSEVEMINGSVADWFHLDIMDGAFVPNISFGFPVVSIINRYATKPLDVHLMICEPERYITQFRDAGADILTVHYEASIHLHRTLSEIRSLGMKAGISINPHTPVSLLKDILPYTDLVLIMSVNPGFGGQAFIPTSINKISELREIIDAGGYNVLIEIDGGVDDKNASALVGAGANVLVAGSSIFGSENPQLMIEKLRQAGNHH